MSLSYLLGGLEEGQFLKEYWERGVLHICRSDRSYYDCIWKKPSISEIIWQTCHSWGEVSLARQQTDYRQVSYASMPATIATVQQAFNEGYTVVINNFERKNFDIARLCRNVEQSLLFCSNVNLYATPANTQGLDPHYDDQDVFILQVEGQKLWRVYNQPVVLPLDDVPYDPAAMNLESFTEYLLNEGDLLYLPRGFVHEARSVDQVSVHLTLSITVIRWVTLLQHILHTHAQHNFLLRQAVPWDVLRGKCGSDMANHLLKQISAESAWSRAVDGLLDNLLKGRPRWTDIELRNIHSPSIHPATSVRIAPDQIFVLHHQEQSFVLKFIGGSIELPIDLEESVTYMCREKTFLIDQIPGQFSIDIKMGMVVQLMNCGFLALSD